MNRFFKFLLRKAIFFGMFAAEFAVLNYFASIRYELLAMNAGMIDAAFQKFQVSGLSYMGVTFILKWIMLGIEMVGVAILAPAVVRTVGRSTWGWAIGMEFREALRIVAILVSLIGDIVMAVYAYSVLWGEVSIGSTIIAPAVDPATLRFSDGVWLGLIAVMWCFTEALPFAFRPSSGIALQLADIAMSFPAIAVILFGDLRYFAGAYAWSTFRIAALEIWTFVVLITLINFAISAWLGKRAIIATGTNVDTVH